MESVIQSGTDVTLTDVEQEPTGSCCACSVGLGAKAIEKLYNLLQEGDDGFDVQ